jgi:FdhD protein
MSPGTLTGTVTVPLVRLDEERRRDARDEVVEEVAVALVYNGVAHAVMMATPTDLKDFALGFSLAEGIVDAPSQLRLVEALRREDGIVLEFAIAQPLFDRLAERTRTLAGSSACGLCGTERLAQAQRAVPDVIARPLDATAVRTALKVLASRQVLNQGTGGAHAAAWCHGEEFVLREDVGRHCAFDKLIGALARSGRDPRPGFAVVSSRASYELVHKAASAGIGTLVAISAPTSAAIALAESCGLRLIAFARDAQMNVYTQR